MTAAIILGSGAGRRMGGDVPKVFLELAGKPVIKYSVEKFASIPEIEKIIITVPSGTADRCRELCAGIAADITIVEGGPTRQETVLIALEQLPVTTKMILIHDGARPLVSADLIHAAIEGVREHGACVPTVESEETIKLVRGDRVVETLKRDEIHTVQTPQAFYYEAIIEAHRHASERKWRVTDDATLIERMGRPVSTIPGERSNIKITHPEDLKKAAMFLE